jgi:OmpA-like transmembrane domain.
MKKILSTSCLLAYSTLALVPAAQASDSPASGFSASIYGGGISSTSKLDRTLTGNANTTHTDLGGKGATAGLMVAYDYAIKQDSIIGLDVFGSWHNMDSKTNYQDAAQDAQFKTKMNYSFGAAAKFGYKLAGTTLGFFRVGYINSHFKLQSKNYAIDPTDELKNKKKNLPGLLLGIGIEVPVAPKLAFGLGYDFALYKKLTLFHQATANHTLKARLHFLNASIKYKF